MNRVAIFWAGGAIIAAALMFARADEPKVKPAEGDDQAPNADSKGCVTCHAGIEDMHPAFPITCVGCHGGKGSATTAEAAHVKPKEVPPNDERVVAMDFDPEYERFLNPSNLRVAQKTCGECHKVEVANLFKSLHATTAGHLCDGLYENGVEKTKTPQHSIFDVADDDGQIPAHGLKNLTRIPAFEDSGDSSKITTHYRDVPRKACMQCHLWGRGRAVRGRLGMDGDYRSEGCAACHLTYADDGLSETADAAAPKFEPGHALKHQFTSKIPTSTCTKCHYGDASIGLHFRGMAQMPPGAPGGPQVPGSTPMRLNGSWYLRDDAVTPPDIHHAKGMNCIDCHTAKDVMGDGNIYGQMEYAIEIECTTCHGTIDKEADFVTERGETLTHLRRDGDRVILTGKVDGKERDVPQVKQLVTPGSPKFNARAAKAMTPEHLKLECYTCHSGWNTNFFGFHFDRNESFSQLDLLSGVRTPGRVTTLEKVFTTFREFRMGWNTEGMLAPYMVGFSTMATARDKNGKYLMDQKMPETAAGLSGMTMVHHQTHTTRPEARQCAECHRSSETWGLGSPNFRLMRDFFCVTTSAGLEVVAFDRKNPDHTRPSATVAIRDARAVALDLDVVQGHMKVAYVSSETQGVTVVDLTNPDFPRPVQRIAADQPYGLTLAGKRLYICDGKSGVRVVDVANPMKPKEIAKIATTDAREIVLCGPIAYLADGTGGLAAIDVGEPATAKILGRASLSREGQTATAGVTTRVITYFQYSRPQPGKNSRTKARLLAFVADDTYGLKIVDATEPSKMTLIRGFDNMRQGVREAKVNAIAFGSSYDLGSEGGRIPSEENDYVYGTLDTLRDDGTRMSYLFIIKVTNPEQAQLMSMIQAQDKNAAIALVHAYNPPFLQRFCVIASDRGIEIADVTKPATPTIIVSMPGARGTGGLALEAMPLDRMIDEDGSPLKDISHDGARYMKKEEFERVLRTPLEK